MNTYITFREQLSVLMLGTLSRIFLFDILFIYIANVLPLLVFSLKPSIPSPLPPSSMGVFPDPHTHSLLLPALAFPYTAASSLHSTKGLSSH